MSKKLLDKKQAVMRSFTFSDLRAKPLTRDDGQDDGIRILEGHASVFEQDTDIGGYFTERISRGAFDDCDFTDVPFLLIMILAVFQWQEAVGIMETVL